MNGRFKRPGRASAQDDERVTQLYHETREDLLAFLLRRCPTAEDAADCLAETYRVAWEKRKRIPAGRDSRAWLFGVARNAAREERRRSKRRTTTTHAIAVAAKRSYTETTPERTALADALAQLSALDQELVMMSSADGMTSREVAYILGLSPNAVRIRAHRARAKLRTLLARHEADDDAELADAAAAASPRP